MTADILYSCLELFKTVLGKYNAFEIHFSIIDPERPLRNLYDFYNFLMNIFADTPLFM